VVAGRVAGAYGVNGWLRVVSFCDPPENLLQYSPWHLGGEGRWVLARLEAGRAHGKGVVAQVAGCGERDQAEALTGALVAVERRQLPALEEGEYYWADLVGLRVEGPAGRDLGVVTGLVETGANDVLVVQGDRERLIPYLPDRVVREVDLAAGRIRVDWDPDF
jgi:16S rRNA processing protein RimM